MNTRTQIYIQENTIITHQVLTVRDTGDIFAAVNVGTASFFFDTVGEIELVRAELQKAEEALANANMEKLAKDLE